MLHVSDAKSFAAYFSAFIIFVRKVAKIKENTAATPWWYLEKYVYFLALTYVYIHKLDSLH